MLREMGACELGIKFFLECFPSGKVELTKKNVYKFIYHYCNNFDHMDDNYSSTSTYSTYTFFEWFLLGKFISDDDYDDWFYSKSPEKAWAILKKYKKD
jgi:hypothetical protein